MRGKKGAEGGPSMLGTVATVVILVALILILILAVTGKLGSFFNIFGQGQDLSTAGKSCVIACASNDYAGWCTNGKDVKGLTDAQSTKLTEAGVENVNKDKKSVTGVTCNKLADNDLIAKCVENTITCA